MIAVTRHIATARVELSRTKFDIYTTSHKPERITISLFDLHLLRATSAHTLMIASSLSRLVVQYNHPTENAIELIKRIMHKRFSFMIAVFMDTRKAVGDICPICMSDSASEEVAIMHCCKAEIHVECFAHMCVNFWMMHGKCWHCCPMCRDERCPFHDYT